MVISEFVSKCTCCSNTVYEFCSAVFHSWGGKKTFMSGYNSQNVVWWELDWVYDVPKVFPCGPKSHHVSRTLSEATATLVRAGRGKQYVLTAQEHSLPTIALLKMHDSSIPLRGEDSAFFLEINNEWHLTLVSTEKEALCSLWQWHSPAVFSFLFHVNAERWCKAFV